MDKLMSQKEVERSQILDRLKEGKISQQEAAQQMDISTRQARRLARRYQREGLAGLISKKCGYASNRRLDETLRATAIALIGAHYCDFGPTLACEKLVELHSMHLSVESTRQLMITAGYWKTRRGGGVCVHPIRERRARFGELIQIDGSPHDWFEGRGERCTLLVFIDDATGKLTQLRFMPTETTLGYMEGCCTTTFWHMAYQWRYIVISTASSASMPSMLSPAAETQFSRAARELSIECIHAHSPQAKGRVERANQTLQDRLVKEMRLAGINDMDTANAWLPGYIADYNRRFAVNPKDISDAHLPYTGTRETLTSILSVQVTRMLSKNLSCQHKNRLLQVATTGTGLGLRGAKVTVHEHFDGSQELLWKKRKLVYSTTDKPQRQSPVADGKSVNAQVDKAVARRNTGHKPASNHPWRNMPVGKSAHDGLCATS